MNPAKATEKLLSWKLFVSGMLRLSPFWAASLANGCSTGCHSSSLTQGPSARRRIRHLIHWKPMGQVALFEALTPDTDP